MTSYLTGEDIEEIDKEVMDDILEQIEEEQKEWFKNGAEFLPGSKRNTATRLQFYEQKTLTMERLMVLDPDYRDKRDEGMYPDLLPVVWYVVEGQSPVAGPFPDDMTALDVAINMGLYVPPPPILPDAGGLVSQPSGTGVLASPPPPPPPIVQQPSFWAQMLQYGEWPSGWSLFKAHSKDFTNLIEALGRRIEGAV